MTPEEAAQHFEALVDRLGAEAAKGLAKAYSVWQSGQITTDAFELLIVQIVAQANAYARTGADLLGTQYLRLATENDVRPIGEAPVTVAGELKRLGKAAKTLSAAVDTDADLAMMLDRVAKNEPAHAGQQQLLHTYKAHGMKGYRRHTDADPCELCVWLVKAHLDPEGIGFIYPTSKPMHRHTGCKCTPVPATRKESA